MKSIRVLIAAVALVCFAAATVCAEPVRRSDTLVLTKRADHFAFIVDMSGSMMMTSKDFAEQKIVLAKRLMGLINDRVPSLDYGAGLYTIAPAGAVVQPGAWDTSSYGKAIANLPNDLGIFGRLTPMGEDFVALQSSLGAMRNGAIVLVSDGYQNLGPDAVAAMRSILQSTGSKLHIISFADDVSDEKCAKETMDGLCSLAVACYNARDLLFNPVYLDEFVENVYYVQNTPVITDSVFFDTAKYELRPDAIATLDNALVTILNVPRGVRTVEIEGFADAQGGISVSNMLLSIRRAQAVKDYLVSKGVPAEKVYAKGNNVSFKFNNATASGRQDNRRADLIIN